MHHSTFTGALLSPPTTPPRLLFYHLRPGLVVALARGVDGHVGYLYGRNMQAPGFSLILRPSRAAPLAGPYDANHQL